MAKGSSTLAAYRAGERASRGKAKRHSRMKPSLAIMAGFLPTAVYAYKGFRDVGVEEGATRITSRLTGYSFTTQKWLASEVFKGWMPVLGGVIAHKAASRLGINRALRAAGLPFSL